MNTVKKHWGAGFEAIYFDGRTFKKLDNITYVTWYGKYDEYGDLCLQPSLVLHNKYHGNVLTISSIQPTGNRFYKVLPIDEKDVLDFDNISSTIEFESDRIASSYIMELPDGKFEPVCTSISDNNEAKISFKDGKLQISGYENIYFEIYDLLSERFSQC